MRPSRQPAAGYAEAAVEELVREHAPLVRRMALQICSRMPASVELDDLVQEGMLGLLDAARRWRPTPQGTPFGVYARHRVRGAIYDSLRRRDALPRYQRDRLRQAEDMEQALTAELGRAVSDEELASALGITPEALRTLTEQGLVASIIEDAPELEEPMADARDAPFESTALPEKGQQVMALHYAEHLSFRDIAFVLSLTPGRISQLHTQALRRLRQILVAEPVTQRRASSPP
jgi:RNA polymerase sigma factor for flagellar operon FliA